MAIRLGLGRDPEEGLRELFAKHLTHVRLRETVTARQGATLELTYLVRLRDEADAVGLVAQLNRVEGVQNVELRLLAARD